MSHPEYGPWLIPGLVKRLTALYQAPARLNYSQISQILKAEFDVVLTRNAILGKIYRLGLPARRDLPRVSQSDRQPHASDKRLIKVRPPMLPEQEQPPGKVTMEELLPHHCRYPSGAWPDITYCGDTRIEDLPYCDDHCRIAYHAWERG